LLTATLRCGAILHLAALSERERFGTLKLCALFDLLHATITSILVILVSHFNIVLREASHAERGEK